MHNMEAACFDSYLHTQVHSSSEILALEEACHTEAEAEAELCVIAHTQSDNTSH